MKLHGVDSTFYNITRSAHHTSTPHHVHIQRRRPNRKHVETLNITRRGAGGPVTSAALLHGRRGPEVLLRGTAQGHAGRWYALPAPSPPPLINIAIEHCYA
jgi:hypothetical protein